jgi:nucleotide-binding universal stress UspA family protein
MTNFISTDKKVDAILARKRAEMRANATRTEWTMAPRTIISYDDTANDRDALMLGRLLAEAGAHLTLAYVRHSTQAQRAREQLEEREAETLLEHGAQLLGDLDVERRVVVSPSTAEGLRWLAESEEAEVIVFGSDYRTAAGHVAPQHSTQTLLEGGPAAIAIAPANFSVDPVPHIRTVGILAAPGDDAAIETARDLADQLGARLTRDERQVDLLVVGSRLEAPEGRVMITAQAQNEIENATVPVLVTARGVPVQFAVSAAVN